MSALFINVLCKNGRYFVNAKTFITVFLYNLADISTETCLKLFVVQKGAEDYLLPVNFTSNSNYEIISNLPNLCIPPIIMLNNNYVISGLCSVARQICKLSQKQDIRNLLGFRESCLVACAENSIWTRFCEIDFIDTIDNLLNNKYITNNNLFTLPECVLKYENHLSKPVRIHNIYKVARNFSNNQTVQSSTPRTELNILHNYAEGPYISLADLILYPCYKILFHYCSIHSLESILPLSKQWFDRLQSFNSSFLDLETITNASFTEIHVPIIANKSLYNAESIRQNSLKHTNQTQIESALNSLQSLTSEIRNNFLPFGDNQNFNWNKIPIEINPEGGALPAKRASRKCHQLETLIKAVLAVVDSKQYRIVDFCSGSGHVGILIAYLLPKCEIILIENKEVSLARARATITKLKLNNIITVQSNLDYFIGEFDLGVALHACGAATDLVIQMCIKNRAHFVCCPCCYGAIKDCHQLVYPRSVKFQNLFQQSNKNQYFNLAHAADQTHENENLKTKQGYFCMDIIDTDRRFYAEENGYDVHLGKLQPVTCTNKNNLLVGLCKNDENALSI